MGRSTELILPLQLMFPGPTSVKKFGPCFIILDQGCDQLASSHFLFIFAVFDKKTISIYQNTIPRATQMGRSTEQILPLHLVFPGPTAVKKFGPCFIILVQGLDQLASLRFLSIFCHFR
jgi:hypothetical protein